MTSKEFDFDKTPEVQFLFLLTGGAGLMESWSLIEVVGSELVGSRIRDLVPPGGTPDAGGRKDAIVNLARNERKCFLGKDADGHHIVIYHKPSTGMNLVYDYIDEFQRVHVSDNLTELLYMTCLK